MKKIILFLFIIQICSAQDKYPNPYNVLWNCHLNSMPLTIDSFPQTNISIGWQWSWVLLNLIN